jgi:magnesium chelatase family protein
MKINSLIQDKNELLPVEVELTLLPGLPGIQFLGLPDQHLKESAFRIKSAIKQSGFQFPTSQQILVNLRPNHKRKTSKGLELAIAAAYLWETEQVPKPVASSDFFVYGELTLGGEVIEPEDLRENLLREHAVVLTGAVGGEKPAPFRRHQVKTLADLSTPVAKPAELQFEPPVRPNEIEKFSFSRQQARLLEILAVGEHSLLLAGPAGSGKTTLTKFVAELLRPPSIKDFRDLRRLHRHFGEEMTWRPVARPHHTTPVMAMIGGGSIPFAGEISRAHCGILVLDELLEYAPTVQEALREPFEEGKIKVVRGGRMVEYPARAQILATTNLCPCGDYTPVKEFRPKGKCRYSLTRCQSYSQRLSGPLVDRFEMLEFTTPLRDFSVSGAEIKKRVMAAQEFSRSKDSSAEVCNSRQDLPRVVASFRPGVMSLLTEEAFSSHRRKQATLRVARTLADLDQSVFVEREHLNEALHWTQLNFERLRRWDC